MESFKGKNVFITGINGFIGSGVADYFLSQNANVVGLVRDVNDKTNKSVLDRCSIVYGDILNRNLIQNIISKYEVDYVLHFASQAIVSICHNDPYSAYMTNLNGLLNILEACRSIEKSPEKIIVMVSDKYYGKTTELPYNEETHPVVADTYCTSKICQDFIALSYGKTYDLPIVTVRSANIYGPGDWNLSRLIPKNIIKLLNYESPVIYSHSANFLREYIYIDDFCNAISILLSQANNHEPYNVGGTEPVTVKNLINNIRSMINPDIKISIQKVDFTEISEQYLDAKKINQLGWEPKWNLDEGLADTIPFYANMT